MGCRELGIAVIARAIRYLNENKIVFPLGVGDRKLKSLKEQETRIESARMSARLFLVDQPGEWASQMKFWCQVAGYDHHAIRERIRKAENEKGNGLVA